MADGARCILQYDYSVPYADPALREVLPDFQTMYILLLILLEVIWLDVYKRQHLGPFFIDSTEVLCKHAMRACGVEPVGFED